MTQGRFLNKPTSACLDRAVCSWLCRRLLLEEMAPALIALSRGVKAGDSSGVRSVLFPSLRQSLCRSVAAELSQQPGHRDLISERSPPLPAAT